MTDLNLPITIPQNNWTRNIITSIGTGIMGSKSVSINDGGTKKPAPDCKDGLLFTANYTCGTDPNPKTISIPNAWGQSVLFDCSESYNKCAGSKLTLDDSGVLTITDSAGNQLWKSETPAGLDSNNPPIALPQYASGINNTDPAPGQHSQNNYLVSGEFLLVGEWIGSPSGKFRLEMVNLSLSPSALAAAGLSDIVSAPSDTGSWVRVAYEGNQFMVPANNTRLRYGLGSKWQPEQKYQAGTVVEVSNKTFGGDPAYGRQKILQMLATTASIGTANLIPLSQGSSALTDIKTLRVVYNILGCTDALPVPTNAAPTDYNSATIYSIPSIHAQNVGKIGYVDAYGKLHPYPDSMTEYKADSEFNLIGDYGVVGGDLGALVSGADVAACKKACIDAAGEKCAAFVYEKTKGTCQLKGPSALTTGQRFINNNYEYYVRNKGIKISRDSCPKDVSNNSAADWQEWVGTDANGANISDEMSMDTKCGYEAWIDISKGEVEATTASVVGTTVTQPFTTMGGSIKEGFTVNSDYIGISSLVNSLTAKYNLLKKTLFDTKVSHESSLNQLQQYKQGLADWNGEQLAQLEAMNEDRELNMQSENLKHNMYLYFFIGVLAIVVFGGLIMSILSFFKKTATSIVPSGPSAPSAVPSAPSAPSAAPPVAAAS